MNSLKQSLNSNMFVKIVSLILGYYFWSISGTFFLATRSYNVPLCFYNVQDKKIEAPETVKVYLKGTRNALSCMNPDTLGVHINAQNLKEGINICQIDNKNLMLAKSIAVVGYQPANLMIKCL